MKLRGELFKVGSALSKGVLRFSQERLEDDVSGLKAVVFGFESGQGFVCVVELSQ